MDKSISLRRTKIVDLTDYVNMETGEPLHDEFEPGSTLKITENSGMSLVTYDEYSVISMETLWELERLLNDADLGKVLKMSGILKTPLNILYNSTIPHTNDSLQGFLRIKSKSMFFKLISRLMKVGVLYQIKGLIMGEVRVMYMMNPWVCKKRKTFENRVLEVFSKFRDN
jgi:hypothetical protein